MKIDHLHRQVNIPSHPRSVALGLFDGLHPGHRQVILAAMQGVEDAVSRCVFTFTLDTVTTKHIPGQLCSRQEQSRLLEDMGVDEWFEADFSDIRHLTPEEFVRDILHTRLGAVQVTCGYNYRFGAGGAGDATLLTELCNRYGITVRVVPEVDAGDTPISSTAIRQALAAGDMPMVRRLWGRPYRIQEPVTQGQKLGRKLGLPTINQVLPSGMACPRFGVYVSCVQIDTAVYPAVTNIGVRPTVGADAPLAETYILDFDGNLYDACPTVYPLHFLREEQAFPSLEALKAQIEQDVDTARAQFTPTASEGIRAVFFDFDDTLDDRDAAFRHGLSTFLSHYYPSLTAAEHTARLEELFLYQRGGYGNIIDYATLIRHALSLWPAEKEADPDRALWRFYHGFAAGGVLHPDVKPTLTALRKAGYLIGVITNGNRIPQTCKMDHCGLRPYLDLLVLAGEEGIQKPDPAVFRLAAARLGVHPSACVYVGDHPVNDLQGAQKAGFHTVLKLAHRDPDHPIHRLPMPADVPVIRQIGELPVLLAEGALLEQTTT